MTHRHPDIQTDSHSPTLSALLAAHSGGTENLQDLISKWKLNMHIL